MAPINISLKINKVYTNSGIWVEDELKHIHPAATKFVFLLNYKARINPIINQRWIKA